MKPPNPHPHPTRRSRPTLSRGQACERGSAALELAILAAAILAILALIVAAGRVQDAHQSVAHAAEDAARAATEARTWPAATSAAHHIAGADLAGKPTCTGMRLAVTGQITPGATVTANLTCTTSLGILPGHLAVTETATAIVDQYRGVG